jgi:hypothetical protein
MYFVTTTCTLSRVNVDDCTGLQRWRDTTGSSQTERPVTVPYQGLVLRTPCQLWGVQVFTHTHYDEHSRSSSATPPLALELRSVGCVSLRPYRGLTCAEPCVGWYHVGLCCLLLLECRHWLLFVERVSLAKHVSVTTWVFAVYSSWNVDIGCFSWNVCGWRNVCHWRTLCHRWCVLPLVVALPSVACDGCAVMQLHRSAAMATAS